MMLSKVRPAGQWAILVVCSAMLTIVLRSMALPAALLLGPMISGIVVALAGAEIKFPSTVFRGAQTVIGCMIALPVNPQILADIAKSWPIFIGSILATVVAWCLVGWAIARWKILPGTTGIWGSSPGAASAMVVMADDFGSDIRIVAFMQYLRVLCVALSAVAIAKISTGQDTNTLPPFDWFGLAPAPVLAQTAALLVGGYVLGRLSHLPSGTLLITLFVGAILRGMGLIDLFLPQPLLLVAYTCIGWVVGLRFTMKSLLQVASRLPHMLAAIFGLMGFCAGIAWLLTRLLGIDMLTAYLATSPGGADSIAIIAASTPVDLPYVLSFQTLRLLVVMGIGPVVARLIAHSVEKRDGVTPR